MKKKNFSCPRSISKSQRRLIKGEQEVGRLRGLYVNAAVENEKAFRRLQIEVRRVAYFADCVDFLHNALIKAKSIPREDIEKELVKYADFKRIAYNSFLSTKEELSVIRYSAYGKECTTNLENE